MKSIHYYQLASQCTHSLISFVLFQNYLHHCGGMCSKDLEAETSALCAEEEEYSNSHIFVAVSEDHICGSIRIFKKTASQQLPTEKLFPIQLNALVGEEEPMYHIGRFAIAKGSDDRGFRIFKTLMVLALNVATGEKGGTVFAECDLKLLRTIRLLGIEAEAIGAPIHYLGSETIPIQLPWAGYQSFLNRNRDLLRNELGIFWQ
ncbi:hypothetical protein QGN23_13700 [Chryseobacterium gotjawalense]|uniref:N-acyl amino acid synthase FeeM catalytic core domain-containing protein n=1 Tax=Chryseobacterium gotjawalense TaxID=3042315 RepID=A0ABY8RE10_9FLAO|nr:hypothetical protein [Chryseobacterium sp. wdc7]WHF51462.1 hypothetical protein QGN23_13700 [Chryseobacterium sp. wdc7]